MLCLGWQVFLGKISEFPGMSVFKSGMSIDSNRHSIPTYVQLLRYLPESVYKRVP